MAYEDCVADVLETVLARDLPDELLGLAVAHEAQLLSEQAFERD